MHSIILSARRELLPINKLILLTSVATPDCFRFLLTQDGRLVGFPQETRMIGVGMSNDCCTFCICVWCVCVCACVCVCVCVCVCLSVCLSVCVFVCLGVCRPIFLRKLVLDFCFCWALEHSTYLSIAMAVLVSVET